MPNGIVINPVRGHRETEDAAGLILELVETNRQRYRDKGQLIEALYRGSWFLGRPFEIPEDYRPPKGDILIAYAGGMPAGTVALCPMTGGCCELKWMYVQRRWRGTGVAVALCNRSIEIARSLGYRVIRLRTGERQPEAHRLYAKLGFKVVSPWDDLPPDGVKYFELNIIHPSP